MRLGFEEQVGSGEGWAREADLLQHAGSGAGQRVRLVALSGLVCGYFCHIAICCCFTTLLC